MGATQENKGGRKMNNILEMHVDLEEVDGKLKIANAKSKYKGHLYWHNMNKMILNNLLGVDYDRWKEDG